jgi:hypothetical protein
VPVPTEPFVTAMLAIAEFLLEALEVLETPSWDLLVRPKGWLAEW